MGRVNYYTNPAEKLFYQKTNFMNGINNSTADDLLPENVEKNLINLDLDYAGALKKRAGFIRHTDIQTYPKLNEAQVYTWKEWGIDGLLTKKTSEAMRNASVQQGLYQWKDLVTSKEYIVMLYTNQLYYKLSATSVVEGELWEYETWQKIPMYLFNETNNTYEPMLDYTNPNVRYPTVVYAGDDFVINNVEVPLFSQIYGIDHEGIEYLGEQGEQLTIHESAWEWYLDNCFAKCYKTDGVAYGEKLYVATGYKLMAVEHDDNLGIVARQLKPIIPTTPEYNTLGGNLLSDDPANSIKSSVGLALQVSGMIITSFLNNRQLRGGIVNNPIRIRTISVRPSTDYAIYYRYKYQKQDENEWTNEYTEHNGWRALTLNDTTDAVWEALLNQATVYNISIEYTPADNMNTNTWEVNNAGLIESYVYTSFEVKETPEFVTEATFSLHTCRRLLTYYGQLLAYYDTVEGDVIYISDYERFDYFPSDYNVIMNTPTNDPVTSINYYQNVLIVLTTNNIFMLKGKNPYNFDISNINRTIGCKYGWTAKVVGNHLYFMSSEGLFKLKTLYNTEDRLNVEQVDYKIKTLFRDDAVDYIAFLFKGNYYLVELAPRTTVYENYGFITKYEANITDYEKGKIYIYDSYLDAWTTYSGTYLNINNVLVLDNNIVVTDRNTNAYMVFPNLKVLDQDFVFYSDGVSVGADENNHLIKLEDGINYATKLEEAYNSFGKPYHTKKFKQLMLKLINSKTGATGLVVTVSIDGTEVVNPDVVKIEMDRETGTIHTKSMSKEDVDYDMKDFQNIELPSMAVLGEGFFVNEAILGEYDISLRRLKFSGKGKTIKYTIEQLDDKFFGILGHATLYKEKKPSVR